MLPYLKHDNASNPFECALKHVSISLECRVFIIYLKGFTKNPFQNNMWRKIFCKVFWDDTPLKL